MKQLHIEWRHFEKQGETCQRCADTGATLRHVTESLEPVLAEHDIELSVTDTPLLASDICQSNTLLFNGVPLEELLDDASASSSPCPSCSTLIGQETECRTVVHGGTVYEEIPADLIRRAAYRAVDLQEP